MGYFSNGYEGNMYEVKYCRNCMNFREDEYGFTCPVMELHAIYNYEEVNKEDSFLHYLIPRDGVHNEECRMYLPDE